MARSNSAPRGRRSIRISGHSSVGAATPTPLQSNGRNSTRPSSISALSYNVLTLPPDNLKHYTHGMAWDSKHEKWRAQYICKKKSIPYIHLQAHTSQFRRNRRDGRERLDIHASGGRRIRPGGCHRRPRGCRTTCRGRCRADVPVHRRCRRAHLREPAAGIRTAPGCRPPVGGVGRTGEADHPEPGGVGGSGGGVAERASTGDF